MEHGSPSRRSWADEAEKELPSPRSLGAGSPGLFHGGRFDESFVNRLGLSDSESEADSGLPPPPPGKGKDVAEGSGRRRRGRHRRRRRRPQGFMAAARRSLPAPPVHLHRSPASHPARALATPDEDGFYAVQSRRRWRRRSPPRVARPVPPELVGLCFNCLANNHVKAECTFPVRCYNCRDEGHRASSCTLPRSSGAKRSRSPPRAVDGGVRRRVSRRRLPVDAGRRAHTNDNDTTSARPASTGHSTSIPHCCRPPSPPPRPSPPTPPVVTAVADASPGVAVGGRRQRVGLVVVPRLAEVQAAEDDLGHSLVVLVGGTRPAMSPAMVTVYLFERFDIMAGEAEVRRHEPEDFVVRFRRRVDRDRVLAAPPTGAPLPLLWRPWWRTSWATAGTFRYRVLVGMRRVPLHARNVATAQTILGPSCAEVVVVRPSDVPDDDEREFFVTAWCADPRFIPDE